MARSLSNIDLNLLYPLDALLRTRHVTKAAALTGVTQPAMSQSLKRLRALFEDDLLIRGRGGSMLTPRALELQRALPGILESIHSELLSTPAFDPRVSRRRFGVLASSSTALVALGGLIQDASDNYPDLAFTIKPLRRSFEREMDDPRVDLALVPEVLPTELPRERLYSEEWVFIVAADNDAIGERITLDDLSSHPHAVYEQDGLRTHAELALESVGRQRRRMVSTEDFLVLFHLVRHSNLIATVQRTVAEALAERNGVRVVEGPIDLPAFGIDMVWNASRQSDPALAWLRDELIARTARR